MNTLSKMLLPLTDQEIHFYGENGYLIIKHGCSSDLTDAFNSYIYTIRTGDVIPGWALPSKDGVFEEKARFSVRIFNPPLYDGFSLQLMKLPIVRGALYQLLGAEAVGVQSMYFYKDPGTKEQAAHQDYYYIKNDPNTMMAASIALDDTDEENGCLWVIPGSHKLGLLSHGKVQNIIEHEKWTHETEGIDLSKEISVIMEKGDVLIFHNLLIHSSTLNRSADRWRRSYVCHYIRHDSTVEREDLKKKISLA